MEQFIREKIKDKPLNKKDLQKSRHSSTLRSGICSGCKHCFAIFLPVINRQSKKLQMEK